MAKDIGEHDRDEAIRRLRREGKNQTEIAKILSVNQSVISRRMKSLGLISKRGASVSRNAGHKPRMIPASQIGRFGLDFGSF